MDNNHICGCGNDHNHQHNHQHDQQHGHCGGGCDHDHHDGGHQTIRLLLDDDRELECSVLEVFQIEEQEYIALLPDGEENVLLYRFNEEEIEGPQLTNIEDEEEFQTVSSVFLEMMEMDTEEEETLE